MNSKLLPSAERRKPPNAGKGRVKGVPNKATRDVKALAGKYAPAAMKELARLAAKAESEPARVAAIKELLDRAYGKAPAAIDLNAAGKLVVEIVDSWAKT